ncbi:Phosphate/pyrophosphate-specific outer membrane porin OprP/OprO [hydrothermal vent metagenome]|uniref:Phosphate/pyrophosphate-specific outer membrane porin OprP/OprO n=1 Tax=hydrothermal vent metagenome TaxID=652676 RepID=A0A3B1DHY4_9ZZZZ
MKYLLANINYCLDFHKLWCTIIFVSVHLFLLSSTACKAQSETTDVQEKIQALQMQLDQLKATYGIKEISHSTTSESHIQQMDAQTPAVHMQAEQKLSYFPDVHYSPSNKYPSVRLTGFFQTDAGWFQQDSANKIAVGNIQNGADFRRARLAATGDVWSNVGYMLEMDFAFPGRPSFMDVWLEVRDIAGGNIRIGQYRNPFGMDGLTSVKEITFLERGLPFAFLPFRQIGIMYYGHSEDETKTWAFSGFRYPTNTFGGNIGDSGGFGLATRLTTLLIDNGEEGVLHLGGGYSFADPANNLTRYRNQPEFFVSETGGAAFVPTGVPSAVPPFVDTGAIATNNFNHFNLELATSTGSFHAQSEFFYATTNQIGNSRIHFSGAYAQAGYLLTGESRPYNRKSGLLGRVKPLEPFGNGGIGAWEIAGRWSYIDLNNKNIQGGRLTDLTFGLNWYLNNHTKFQFNYIHAFLDKSPGINGPVVNDSNANIVAFRAQVDF